MNYLIFFLISVISSLLLVFITKRVAEYYQIIDKPDNKRKVHKTPVPLMGGVGIFVSFFVMLYFVRDIIVSGNLNSFHWFSFFIGGLILMIGGFLDDKYNLSPRIQILFPILAIICVIQGGVGIEKITNPMGGYLYLNTLLIGGFLAISDLIIFFWLMGMMYTTKLLDGVDGLVSGVTAIGAFIIFLFTVTTKYFQPDVGMAALILSGACFGFLFFNWHPAKIFLGEGGSLFLGYALGVLAIISGGKIAIALLVMGIPIMDVIWTILRRLKNGKNPFKFSDQKHLHHKILSLGIGQRKTVMIYYFFSTAFGLSALFLQSRGKVFVLLILVLIMLMIIGSLNYLEKRRIN